MYNQSAVWFFLFALKFTISRCPFPFSERNFLIVTYLKPAVKTKQSVSHTVWIARCPGRPGWFLSVHQLMKIQGGSSLSLLSRESCFLSNLFLLSLLVNEVMQLFIHNEPMGLLGFDREMNYFGEVLQYISASTLSLFIVRCCISVHFLQLLFPVSSIFLT